VDPVIWFEAIEDVNAGASNGKIACKQRKSTKRRDSYTVTSDEEDQDSSDSSEDDDNDVDAQAEWDDAAGPSSSSAAAAISAGNSYACCHITHNSLHFLVPVRRECEPIPGLLSGTV
jgi:hypothetical protein